MASYIHIINIMYTVHKIDHIDALPHALLLYNVHIHTLYLIRHYTLYPTHIHFLSCIHIHYYYVCYTLYIQELKVALGLLLKHRGGPGFGHGRLDGPELTHMSVRLRNIAVKLSEEAVAHL